MRLAGCVGWSETFLLGHVSDWLVVRADLRLFCRGMCQIGWLCRLIWDFSVVACVRFAGCAGWSETFLLWHVSDWLVVQADLRLFCRGICQTGWLCRLIWDFPVRAYVWLAGCAGWSETFLSWHVSDWLVVLADLRLFYQKVFHCSGSLIFLIISSYAFSNSSQT